MFAETISVLIGYFAGSIPFGLLLAQAAGLGDIRKIGSGNIGATNVLRTGNKSVAALTLSCDVLKGLLPVLFARWLGGDLAAVFAGFAAMAGHIFPIWLGFKGGKGVATAAGALFGWSWPVAITAVLGWGLVFSLTRISSLSALCAIVASVIGAVWFDLSQVWFVGLLGVVVVVTHRANIGRLLKGEEPKSSFAKAK